ncbi:protein PTHB1 isoform X2 [Ischnura elegans]|uniref:protein PTHB1 isoform X2 n=1 Tax=Ischnura elegans TaxID=197161 RepID=UPI001ED8BA0F|nr:protein PTHB1 isoform X2 [Ischnura elegans]
MSVFSSYEWWSIQCSEKFKERIESDEEEGVDFHDGSLHVTDLIQSGSHIIVVGNNAGKLWAFKPSSSSSPQDLLFECNFSQPILAFESGYLLPGSPGKQIAVLHPKQLTIYLLKESFGSASHGQQFHLQPAYSISFQFEAYSMLIGAFGSRVKTPGIKEERDKKKNQDAICVQAMDGSLHFFENDLNMFSNSSSNDNGGVIALQEKSSTPQISDDEKEKNASKRHSIRAEVHGYPSTDYLPQNASSVSKSKVVSDTNSDLLSKTSKVLAETEEEFQQFHMDNAVIEEDAVQLIKAKFTFAAIEDTNLPTHLCYLPMEDSFVVFSGSWTIDCYRYATFLMHQINSRRKKTSSPEWSHVLDNKLMLLVSSEEGTLLVYDAGPDTSEYANTHFGSLTAPPSSCTPKLIWSAKLPNTPIAMARANFEELSGLVVILTAEGHLVCCHLGTTPKNFTLGNFSRTQMKELGEGKLMQPESTPQTSNATSTSNGAVELSLEFVINNVSLQPVFESGGANNNDGSEEGDWKSSLEADMSVILTPMIPLNNVCLSVTLESPMKAMLGQNFIERLYEETLVPLVVRADFNSFLQNVIPNLMVEVTVSCFGGYSATGEESSLMVFHTTSPLPLSAVFSQEILHSSLENGGSDAALDPSLELKTSELHFQGCRCPAVATLFPEFPSPQSDDSMTSFELYTFGHEGRKVKLVRRCRGENFEEKVKDCSFSLSSAFILPLYYLASVLAQKLENYSTEIGNQITGNPGKPKFFYRVTPKDCNPLEELLETIDAHATQRKNVAELNKQLGFLINQLHMAECCILSRVKDTTPKRIMSSEILMEQFLGKIFCIIKSLSSSQQELYLLSKRQEIISHLVMQLHPECAAPSAFKTLGNIMSLSVKDAIDQGWEERTMANLAFFLRRHKKLNLHNVCDNEALEVSLSAPNLESLMKDVVQLIKDFSETVN